MQKYLVVFCLLMVSACSTLIDNQAVKLADGVYWAIKSPQESNTYDAETILLTVNYQNDSHQMLVTKEAGISGEVFAAVSPQGVSIFELVLLHDGTITANSFLPMAMDPAFILSDMQLIHLPLNFVQQGLDGANVSEEQYEGYRKRSIDQQDRPLIEIKYFEHKIVFQHVQRNYQLIIENLE